MNDYKELIDELRFLSGHVPEQMCDDKGKDALEKAADAIETLLAERDAAVHDINEMLREPELDCEYCKWGGDCPEEFYSCYNNAEWRGPGVGSDGKE